LTVTACIHYGIASGIKKGYLDSSYLDVAEKAFKAIEKNITKEGYFLKTSGPTPVLDMAKDYNEVACTISYYGQGIGILSILAQVDLDNKL
jgi:unsaturated rhamnogalacturonyl hydrolase